MAVCCPSWRGDKSPFPIKSNELYYSSALRNAKASGLSREKQQTLHTWIHSNCDISNYQCNYYNLTISLQSRRPGLFKTNKKDTARNPWQFAHLKWRNSISPQLLPQIAVKYKFSTLFSNTFFSFHRNKSKPRKHMGFCASVSSCSAMKFSGSWLPCKGAIRLLWKQSSIFLTSQWRQKFCASHLHHLQQRLAVYRERRGH